MIPDNDNRFEWQHYAASALSGLIANPDPELKYTAVELAHHSGLIADAMLAERQRRFPDHAPTAGHYPDSNEPIWTASGETVMVHAFAVDSDTAPFICGDRDPA